MNKRAIHVACIGVLLVAGCGGRTDLRPVTGRVTLDGEPLGGVIIVFQPENGPPSSAITDAEGKFTLEYNVKSKGAMLGPQKVRLEQVPGESRQEIKDRFGIDPARVPAKFLKVFQTVEVTDGNNEFQFDLKSQG